MSRHLRILIADDHPQVLATVQRMLTAAGYDCLAVSDGSSALEQIDRFKPDLIVTDVHMPLLSGLELVKELRSRSISVGVVVMTGAIEVEADLEAMRLGAYEYLLKPFGERDLLNSVERVIAKLRQVSEDELGP